MKSRSLVLMFFLLGQVIIGPTSGLQCGGFQDNDRIDCYPEPGASPQGCQARGCCWQSALSSTVNANDASVPYCFFPKDVPSYNVDAINNNNSKIVALLSRAHPSGRPVDIPKLRLTVTFEGPQRLRLRFEDANNARWEPPIPLNPIPAVTQANSDFQVSLRRQPFGLTIKRKSGGQQTLFDTASMAAPLIFADQFLQITTRLSTTNVYGIGEQRRNFTHDLRSSWEQIALWARDQPPTPKVNLYGTHNFMLGLMNDGSAYGVFLLNSNAQEVVMQPTPAMTYRTIGGILDFFLFSGPSPQDVIQQYTALIGRPMMPPYWSLGFHLSRYGYGTLTEMNKTLNRNLAAGFPLDVQWNDIDYMNAYRDWTYDLNAYKGLPDFVSSLHARSMHYVIIVDPGISNANPGHYPPYDEGLAKGVFVMKSDGSVPIIGKVWPGTTAYPDFTCSATLDWWRGLAADFHKVVSYDGIWIDMNEPSNFLDGSTMGCPGGSPLDNPPYTPAILGRSLIQKTICPSSKHRLSTHYNLHNMYGYYEANVTNDALKQIIPGKRPFLLTRSSFAGSGRYTFHWTGDNQATWDNLHFSIGQVLNFNMFGIPMVGADICGFLGDTNEELCTRWMQLGAFYPFMRNHNTLGAKEQDPAIWSKSAQAAMLSALRLRYSILPYLYTQFYFANVNGSTVARPLFFEFPLEPATAKIDAQFLLGPSILVSPVVTQGATTVAAYIPKARWCDLVLGVPLSVRGAYTTLPAPLDRINAHLRGGSVIATQPSPVPNTAAQRATPYQLRACLDDTGRASGGLYVDDGESPMEKGAYNFLLFALANNALIVKPIITRFNDLTLESVWVSGIQGSAPTNVTLNGQAVKFSFDSEAGLLSVYNLGVSLLKPLLLRWNA